MQSERHHPLGSFFYRVVVHRVGVLFGVLLCVCVFASSLVYAGRPLFLEKGAAFLGARGRKRLVVLLKKKGYAVRSSREGNGLYLRLFRDGALLFRMGSHQRRYKISLVSKDVDVSVRSVVTFLELFLLTAPVAEEDFPAAQVLKGGEKKRKKRKKGLVLSRKPGGRRLGAKSSREVVVGRLVPEVVRVSPVVVRRTSGVVERKVRGRGVKKVALLGGVGVDSSLVPRQRVWGVELMLSVASGFQVGGGALGGVVSPKFRWGRFLGGVEVSLQRMLGVSEGSLISLRPGFSLSYLLWESPVQGWLELGGDCELLWMDDGPFSAFRVRWGGHVGGVVLIPFLSGWSFYVRPSLFLFSRNFLFELRGQPLFTATFWRFDLLLGVQIRFL